MPSPSLPAQAQQPASHTPFKVGQLVTVDGKWLAEITEYLWSDFYRLEVETDAPKHEYWTVSASRMEATQPSPSHE